MLRTQKGGITNEFPKPSAYSIRTPKELQQQFRFYSLTSHGAQLPVRENTVFLVPENTWILFVARAGEFTPKIKAIDPILNDFRYLREKNQKYPFCVPDTTPRTADETEDEWYQRAFTCMENGQLFKDILYDSSNPTNASRSSLYQPGDLVQNVKLLFHNEDPPWGPVGVWELPLKPSDHLKLLEDGRKRYVDAFNSMRSLSLLKNATMFIKKDDHPRLDQIISALVPESFEDNIDKEELDDNIQYLMASYTPFKTIINDFIEERKRISKSLIRDQELFYTHYKNLTNGFTTMNDRRETSLYDLLYKEKNIQRGFRVIIAEMCRKSMKDAFPAPKRLTRALSFTGRIPIPPSSTPVCFRTLLKLNKEGFRALLAKKNNPHLQSLLDGQELQLDTFHTIYTGTPLRTPVYSELENLYKYHSFQVDDTVLMFDPKRNSRPKSVLISDLTMTNAGLHYDVFDMETADVIKNVKPGILWKSEQDVTNYMKTINNSIAEITQIDSRAERRKAIVEQIRLQQEQEGADILTFMSHRNQIRGVKPEEKQFLLSYNHPVKVVLPPPPATAAAEQQKTYNLYNNREGFVKSVSINDRGTLVANIFFSSDNTIRPFRPEFLVPIPPKTGGTRKRRKTMRKRSRRFYKN